MYIKIQPSHSKSTPAWNIILDSTSCTTSGSVNSGGWFVGLVGLFIHDGGLLKNLRFAVAGDHWHALADDLGDSCVLLLESDDWVVSDKAASLCFNLKVVGGITHSDKKKTWTPRVEVCHCLYNIDKSSHAYLLWLVPCPSFRKLLTSDLRSYRMAFQILGGDFEARATNDDESFRYRTRSKRECTCTHRSLCTRSSNLVYRYRWVQGE